jgi:hypothetical protein
MESELKKLIKQRDSEQLTLFSNEELGIKPKLKQLDMFTEQLIKDEKLFVDKFLVILNQPLSVTGKLKRTLFSKLFAGLSSVPRRKQEEAKN